MHSELWAAAADGKPLLPQRDADRVLRRLPALSAGAACQLLVMYQTPVASVPEGGLVELEAPALLLHGQGKDRPTLVPLADLEWSVELPSGYRAVAGGGTVVTNSIRPPRSALAAIAQSLFAPEYSPLILSACGAARESSRSAHRRALELEEARKFDESSAVPSPAEAPTMAPAAGRDFDSNLALLREESKPVAWPAAKPEAAASDKPRKPMAGSFGGTRRSEREEAAKKAAAKARRDLQGVRSLLIDARQDAAVQGSVVTFTSLGHEPRLAIELAKRSRTSALGWALGLTIFLCGLTLTRRTVTAKARWVLGVGIAALCVPLVTELTDVIIVANMAFCAAACLVPYYLVAGLVRWVAACARGRSLPAPSPAAAVAAGAIVVLAALSSGAVAAEPPASKIGPYMIHIIEPPKPVVVPDDVILRPYDPKSPKGIEEATRLLVPYAKYVELWNKAHPDKQIETRKAPAEYALAGGSYRATLAGDDYLVLSGRLEIDVFTDQYVSIPLGLQGGVLARAELDGRPARLSLAPVARRETKPQKAIPQQARPAGAPSSPESGSSLVLLYVSGKGRHELALEVRLRLTKQGGWRVAEGVLPAAPATALLLTVPKPQTEVRLSRLADRVSYDTEKPDEPIETSLGDGGALGIQWRPKVAEGQVDLSLTARSQSKFDVQEDGLRMECRLQLEFRRSTREFFRVEVPGEYLVEKVEGTNVRGWEVRKDGPRQSVEVTLLKTARDTESFTVHLGRRGPVGAKEFSEFDVPTVTVSGAALHQGQITVRRSPLLDLRTISTKGVSRADLGKDAAEGSADVRRSPLGLKPFQAYEFATTPFALHLAAAPVPARATAQWQTVLRIGEYERSVEARLILTARDRPIRLVEVFVPEDLDLRNVSAPGEFQWALTTVEGRRLLSVYLASGQQGQVNVLVRGTLGKPGAVKEVPLPRFEARNADRQEGAIAVQADPAFNVEPVGLEGCQPVLLHQVHGWLNPQQRELTRLAIEHRRAGYRGTVRLALRQPTVSCFTITNVRVTREAVEETILLQFTITNAGIRQLSFLLPASAEEPRIQVPMLRQKTFERAGPEPNAPWRVRIELQEERIGQLSVLVRNDRVVGSGACEAPIPTVETGRTDQQFIALETSGRDEVVVQQAEGLEPLGRQQRQWQTLKDLLKGNMSQAYLVSPGAKQPRLVFQARGREAIETAAARITLGETTLVMDAQGAYRAAVVYWVDNATEQFLEVQLPAGAELWTAQVAGEPVTPIVDPAAGEAGRLRVPLVRTPPGQPHYPVVLKYGGRLPPLGTAGAVEFPTARTFKINVELSHLRLYLPTTHRWVNFGQKMRMAQSEEDLTVSRLDVELKQAERLLSQVRSGEDYEKVRAANVLKTLLSPLSSIRESARRSNAVQQEMAQRGRVLEEAERELGRLEGQPSTPAVVDNRYRLNELYEQQRNSGARNVVKDLDYNWDFSALQKPAVARGAGQAFRVEGFATGQPESDLSDKKAAELRRRSDAQPPASAAISQRVQVAALPQGQAGDRLQFAQQADAGGADQRSEIRHGQKAALRRDGATVVAEKESKLQAAPQGEETLKRYKQRLAAQSAEQFREPQGQMMPGYSGGGGLGGQTFAVPPATPADSFATMTRPSSGPVPPRTPAPVVVAETAAPPAGPGSPYGLPSQPPAPKQQAPVTGLASLDFELPQQGVVYRFTTPRGEVEMSAWAVSDTLLARLGRLVPVLVLLVAAWLVLKALRRGVLEWFLRPQGGAVLLAVGLVGLCLGLHPLVALGLFGAAIVILIVRLLMAVCTDKKAQVGLPGK